MEKPKTIILKRVGKKNENVMKKISLVFLLSCLSVVFLTAQSSHSRSDAIDTYVSQGYTLANDYAFTLKAGEEKYLDRDFYASNEYKILAFNTEYGVLDLDIYVDYTSGENYIKDNDNDNTNYCICSFTPSFERNMRVRVKNYRSNYDNYSYDISLLIFYK